MNKIKKINNFHEKAKITTQFIVNNQVFQLLINFKKVTIFFIFYRDACSLNMKKS